MKSMTGFGSSAVEGKCGKFHIEIRSYNHRFLDLRLKIHKIAQAMEPRIYQWARKRLERGRVEILLQWEDLHAKEVPLRFQPEAVRFFLGVQDRLHSEFGLSGQLDVPSLIGMREVVSPVEAGPELEDAWADVEAAMEKAIQGLEEMQRKEGQALREDVEKHVRFLWDELDRIEEEAKEAPERYRQRLEEKVSRLLAPELYDAQRFAQEIVLHVDRVDISEEISRLRSHIEVCRKGLNQDSMSGKRLDFLAQEMHREVNTIGSKSVHAETIHRVVSMKTELEKIREQAQNLL